MSQNDNGNKVMSREFSTSRSGGRQFEIAKRQAILMRIIEFEANKGRTPTFEKLASMMREDHWVSNRWPGYSGQQVSYDFNKVMALTKDDLKALAVPYLVRQLNIIDDTTDALKEMVDDDQLDDDTRIKAANSLRGYVGETAKIFALYAPRETHIKKQEVTGTIDDFMRLRKQAEIELSEISDVAIVVDEDGNEIED